MGLTCFVRIDYNKLLTYTSRFRKNAIHIYMKTYIKLIKRVKTKTVPITKGYHKTLFIVNFCKNTMRTFITFICCVVIKALTLCLYNKPSDNVS